MKKRRKKELQQKKKELKDDIFVQSVSKALEKAVAVKTYVIVAVVAIVAALIVVGFVSEHKQTMTDKGWSALAELEESVGKMESTTQEERDAMENEWLTGLGALISKTEGSTAQAVAVFYHADALFKKGGEENVEKAGAQCRFFLENFPNNYYALAVKQLLGKALFEQEKHDEALEVFTKVYETCLAGKAKQMRPIKYETSYYVGRCQELTGEVAMARITYEQLASEDNDSPLWAQMARFRLSKMKS